MKVAIIGGGIAGVTAAWQLHRLGQEFTLYEASNRLGGTVETIRRDGFVLEGGPDGWVSEKSWARDLAIELGLESELIGSNDAGRVTYIVQNGKLVAMPGAMRMMVPTSLAALEGSPLFSVAARTAYAAEVTRAEELRASAPAHDESVASFVQRHFGPEVLTKIAGPLLSGVFGGDVATLSMRAVMPRFLALEREHGSLVAALAGKGSTSERSVFTTLTSGVGTLVERMVAELPPASIRLKRPVLSLTGNGQLATDNFAESYDQILLATPAHVTASLLGPPMAGFLTMEASSAVLCALAFDQDFDLPRGFGFLVPEGEGSGLLAGTFVDQKFNDRVPAGSRLLRGFFGGQHALDLMSATDDIISTRTLKELEGLLGTLPTPKFSMIRRWPRSLPQYSVGHLERMAELATHVPPNLHLLGNAYHGVGLPDLIRDARHTAEKICS